MEDYKLSKTLDFNYYIKQLIIYIIGYIIFVITFFLISKFSTNEFLSEFAFYLMLFSTIVCFVATFYYGYRMVFLNLNKASIKWKKIKDYKVIKKNFLFFKRVFISFEINKEYYKSRAIYSPKYIKENEELVVGITSSNSVVVIK